MKTKLKLAIFDLDGTLIDSARDIANAVNIFRGQFGLKPLRQISVISAIGQGVGHLLGKTVPARLLKGRPNFKEEFRKVYYDHCAETTRLFPGARRTLKELKRRGVVLTVASNKPTRLSERILRVLEVRRLFSAVLCGDDVTRPKPHPQSLLMLMRRFRAKPSETVMVGDSRFDLEAGNRAKCLTAACTWGFGSRAELARYKPTITMRRMEDLLRLCVMDVRNMQ